MESKPLTTNAPVLFIVFRLATMEGLEPPFATPFTVTTFVAPFGYMAIWSGTKESNLVISCSQNKRLTNCHVPDRESLFRCWRDRNFPLGLLSLPTIMS